MPILVRLEHRPARVARHAPAFRSIAVPVRLLPDGWMGQPHRIAARPSALHSALAPVVSRAAGVARSNPPRPDPIPAPRRLGSAAKRRSGTPSPQRHLPAEKPYFDKSFRLPRDNPVHTDKWAIAALSPPGFARSSSDRRCRSMLSLAAGRFLHAPPR